MKKELFKITPDFNELESECPKTSSIHLMLGEKSELTSLEREFHFPENKHGLTPFYIISKLEKEHLANVSESVYGAMIASLDILFHPDNRKYIEEFFSPEFVKCYPEFIDYAIYTYQNKHKAISGRFDFAYDFSSGCVTGVYESNMDSPVTYYDSVVLQHHLCKKLGNPEHQWNEHHESLINAIPSIISGQDKRIAFLCDVQSTEDSISTETLFHAFNEEGSHIAIFDMLSALEFDFTDLRKPCFSIRDAVIDAIYSLYPWEYMVEDFYNQGNNPLLNWKAWADSTRFIEPAWRYFLSNKGMFAWLTFIHEELSHESEDAKRFMMNHKNAFKYILPSYVDKPTGDGEWIKKPLLGRQSANVSHIKNGTEVALTDGDFVNSGWLYQKYMQTGSADSGNTKAIVCTWMCPDNKARSLEMEMKGISVREFNDALPTYETERFVPHLMLEK